MIQVKSLYKSFEGKDVLVDINATFNNGKDVYKRQLRNTGSDD